MSGVCETYIEFLSSSQEEAESMRRDFQKIIECGRRRAVAKHYDAESFVDAYFSGFNNTVDYRLDVKSLDGKVKKIGNSYGFAMSCEGKGDGKIGLFAQVLKTYYPKCRMVYTERDKATNRYARWDKRNLISKPYHASLDGKEADIGSVEELSDFVGGLYAPPEDGCGDDMRSAADRIRKAAKRDGRAFDLNEYAYYPPQCRTFYRITVNKVEYGIPVNRFDYCPSIMTKFCVERFINKKSKGGKA